MKQTGKNTMLLVCFCCTLGHLSAQQTITTGEQPANPKITFQIFENNKQQNKPPGWGYDIYLDGRHYVHQKHIPSVQGNTGFATKEDAEKTAQLVIKKIEKNIMPPGITPQELDSLGVVITSNVSHE